MNLVRQKLMNKKILMVCYYYPPLNDVGCRRSVAFSKYFKKYGLHPYVLSVKNPDKAYCSMGSGLPPEGVDSQYSLSLFNYYWLINNLDAALKKILSIFKLKLKYNHFYNLFCIPDHFIGWVPLAIWRGWNMIKENKIDYIYISCSPHSSALIGILLKKLTKKLLIIDYRDPFHLSYNDVPKYRAFVNRKLQRYFLEKSDITIINNEDTKRYYEVEYPEYSKKLIAIHNGFDAEILKNLGDYRKFSKFTIIYTGEFYFDRIPNELIFKAISSLYRSGKINKDNFQFIFYGDGVYRINELAKKLSVQDFVIARNRIAYKKVLIEIRRSHLQLLRILKPMISTKLFEGIPLNTPFLATIPKGEAQNIIQEFSPSSIIVNNQSEEEVSNNIINIMNSYMRGSVKDNHVNTFLNKFSRENLTINLMNVISSYEKFGKLSALENQEESKLL